MISTQISGARSSAIGFCSYSCRVVESQATSIAFTPSDVESGHSGNRLTLRQQLKHEPDDFALTLRVRERGRWTHNDVTVTISFNSVRQSRQRGIRQNLLPPSQAEGRLSLE